MNNKKLWIVYYLNSEQQYDFIGVIAKDRKEARHEAICQFANNYGIKIEEARKIEIEDICLYNRIDDYKIEVKKIK